MLAAGYLITFESDEIDHQIVWEWIRNDSYWAAGRSWTVHQRAVADSQCVAVLTAEGATAAFARLVTDGATFGWLCDLVVLPEHRGLGLGKALVEAVVADSDLLGVGRLMLATRDAHSLYDRYGFAPLADPARWMERRPSDVEDAARTEREVR